VKTRDKAASDCAELRDLGNGRWTVILHGRLNTDTVGPCWRKLRKEMRDLRVQSLAIDAHDAVLEGTIGIALLRYLTSDRIAHGAEVSITGISDETRALMETFSPPEHVEQAHAPPLKTRVLEELGAAVRSLFHDLYEQVAFIGVIAAALPSAILQPRRMR
jgi:ABC-type transporter Mla MlaB component